MSPNLKPIATRPRNNAADMEAGGPSSPPLLVWHYHHPRAGAERCRVRALPWALTHPAHGAGFFGVAASIQPAMWTASVTALAT